MAKTQDDTSVPLAWSPLAARGGVRQWRLHACGCARRSYPRRGSKRWLDFLSLVERYADGEATKKQFEEARAEYQKLRKPRYISNSGDFGLAFQDTVALRRTWHSCVITPDRAYTAENPDYELVLPRFRVLEDLIGPDPLPVFEPAWSTDTAVALARVMSEAREFSPMPILADALQDAGCECPVILAHCRDGGQVHVRGCWVIDAVLAGAATRNRTGRKRKARP